MVAQKRTSGIEPAMKLSAVCIELQISRVVKRAVSYWLFMGLLSYCPNVAIVFTVRYDLDVWHAFGIAGLQTPIVRSVGYHCFATGGELIAACYRNPDIKR